MPKGYVIAHIEVTDPEQYAIYRTHSTQAAQAFGGRFLVRGGTQQVQEGQLPPRTVVLEFDSYAQALAFYQSEQYQQARQHRLTAATAQLLCVEGA